jgi:hypothetical protein
MPTHNRINPQVPVDPQDLARLLVSRANPGDVEGMVALYEPEAVLAVGTGRVAIGRGAIRKFYTDLIARGRRFDLGQQRPALVCGELALTSTRLPNGTVTAEVARKQSDGTWLWVIDQPSIASSANAIEAPADTGVSRSTWPSSSRGPTSA